MRQDHTDYINFAELAKRCDLSENDIRLLILREKLVPSIWLDHFALNPSGPSGFYYLLSPRQNEAFSCAFFNASCVRFGRGHAYVPEQTLDVKFYDILPVSLDNVITSGVVMRDEVERLEQSRREATPLESEAITPSPAPVVQAKAKRCTWWDVASPYMVKIMQEGQYATAKELYNALEAKAGLNSPFDKGTGSNRFDLFIRETASALKLKTVQNNWQKLRTAAAQK